MNLTELAAIVAAGLVRGKRYLVCVKRGNYSSYDGLGEHSVYALDAERVAKDALAVASKLKELTAI